MISPVNCPKCKINPLLKETISGYGIKKYLVCPSCNKKTPRLDTRTEVIELWNEMNKNK